MMERICIYNRCSTEEENQKNALEIQVKESVEIVQCNEQWQIVDQFIESQSGTTSAKRSKYQEMLTCIEQGKYTIIVIKSIDRLARNTKDWYLFLDCIVRNNTRLYIYLDNKFYSPEDSLITGIKAILAEEFSRELSKKIKNAHRRRQNNKTGYNICSEMFGWNKIAKDLYEINEMEADAIRQAYRLLEQGYGFDKISKEMYQRGVRSKMQKKIAPATWRKILRSSRMYGTVTLHQTEYDFNKHKEIKLPETEWIFCENALPPIVSKEYYLYMLKIMNQRSSLSKARNDRKRPNKIGGYELSGKILCATCGKVFYRRTQRLKKGKRVVWVCSTYVNHGVKKENRPEGCISVFLNEEVLKNCIFNTYIETFPYSDQFDEDILNEILEILNKIFMDSNYISEIKKLERKVERLKLNKEKALEKLFENILSDEDYQIFVNKSDESLQRIAEKLSQIREQRNKGIDLEKRLGMIKTELYKSDILEKAKNQEILKKVKEIKVYDNNTLEVFFEKNNTVIGKKIEL